ncbi:MAG: response regulator [Gallionella sp.]
MQSKLFNNSPLAIKLLLVPAVAALSFAAYLIYSSYVISDANSVLVEFRDIDYPILDAIEKNRSSHEKIVDALHTAAATGEIEYLSIARVRASEMIGRYETLERLDTAHTQTIRILRAEFARYLDEAVDIAQRMAKSREMPNEQHVSSMRASRDRYLSDAANYQAVAEKDFHQDIDIEIARANRARQWGMAIGVFMLVVIALLTLMVTRGILALEKVVSDRNRMLLKANADLEQEIAKLTAAEAAKMQAQSANRIKDQFLANMSHELRTPMHAVLGLSHLCLQTRMSPKQRDYLQKIHIASSSLLEILNDILDISKIESGKMEVDSIPFDLQEVIGNVATIVRSKAQEKGVSFTHEIAADVQTLLIGDPLRLGQVLINLASNAVKFTERGEVTVRAETEVESANDVVIRFVLTDTGIGLTKFEIEKLFRPFTQADNSITRRFGGTGLGLSISKCLIELMGGAIGVESVPGVGSKFTFTARFAKDKGSSLQDVMCNLHGMRVLVASADAAMPKFMNDFAESYEFDVTCTSSIRDILELFDRSVEESTPYRLVICDSKLLQRAGRDAGRLFDDDPRADAHPKVLLYSADEADIGNDAPGDRLPIGVSYISSDCASLEGEIAKLFAGGRTATGKRSARDAHSPDQLERIRGSRILLVEDNEINRQVAKELLEGFGVKVVAAENGKQAISRLAEDQFDCVLMDLQMPVMDGISATREIRKNPAYADLPVIALTANVMVSEQKEILSAGMNDHVGKPINIEQLVATLARWVKPGPMPEGPAIIEAHRISSHKHLPLLPGVSVAESVGRIGGKLDVYYLVLEQFRRSEANAMSNIQEALSNQEFDVAVRLAHTLRGILATIGADTLSELVGKLETKVKSGTIEGVDPMIKKINQELAELLANIDRALG